MFRTYSPDDGRFPLLSIEAPIVGPVFRYYRKRYQESGSPFPTYSLRFLQEQRGYSLGGAFFVPKTAPTSVNIGPLSVEIGCSDQLRYALQWGLTHKDRHPTWVRIYCWPATHIILRARTATKILEEFDTNPEIKIAESAYTKELKEKAHG